jgi:hypothetical protein
MTPVHGDDEKYARERKRDTCDDRSGGGKLELRDLRRGKPDSREQDEQEADFRKASAGVMRQSEGVHVWHLSCPAPPVSRLGDLEQATYADASDVRDPLLGAIAERIRTQMGDRASRRYLSVLRVGRRAG